MKNIKPLSRLSAFLLLIAVSSAGFAEELIMTRVKQTFPETMVNLQSAIKQAGYTISRVQRVDIGLTKSGFMTDKYRVVFFGKADELNTLSNKYPDIIPFLPLKISIFAENNETILVTNSPLIMKGYFKDIPEKHFNQWEDDVHKILSLTSNAD
ncbi:MAG: DUF302 domain-containing protein [Gammaproteobacteria bacterium]|nr:DUF302 domain-containing protein [Gammaproteobacteria bacterium]